MTAPPDSFSPPEQPLKRRIASVTVNDVARLAGVSAMTVSRAINSPELLSAATLAKLQAAIAQAGYVPNLVAGGLRSSKSRLVAALVPTLTSPVFNETIQSLTAALSELGYQLMLGQSGYADSREDDLLSAIIGRRPDGIVLTGVVHSDEARKKLRASNIPVVETWDLTDDPIDMLVGFSHSAVADAVCRYLVGKGHRRLAVIGANDERSQRRSHAFVESALQQGLMAPLVHEVEAPTTLASGRAGLAAVLQQRANVEAVFCSSDLLALGVLTEASALGIRVPERLAIIGFGDLAFARDLHPALTTVHIDGVRIGNEAARCIVDRVEGRPVANAMIDIGFNLIERASA